MGARSLLLLRYHRMGVDAYSEKCLCFSFAIDVLGVSYTRKKEMMKDSGTIKVKATF